MMRNLTWVGSSEKDFLKFPQRVQYRIAKALTDAQVGKKTENAKPLKGFPGASVQEIVESDPSGTYRCVYTVKLKKGIYVLHSFQKKSHHGIATPKQEVEMIKRRLKRAEEEDREFLAQQKKGKKR